VKATRRTGRVAAAGCVALCLGVAARGDQAQEPPGPPIAPPTAATVGTGAVPAGDAPMAVIRTSPLRGVSARVAALMMSGQLGGSIPITALAWPVAAAPDKVRLFFAADIEGTNLLAGQEKPKVSVEVYAYAVSAQGSVAGAMAEAFTIDLDRAVDLLSRASLKFIGSLEVPPGAYTLRVAVRNAGVGSFGVTAVPNVTPAGEGTFSFLSPLLVGEPAAAWVLVRAGDDGGAAPGHPFSFLARGSLPATRPVLASRADASVWLLVRGAAPGASTMPVRVLGREWKEAARCEATVLERRDVDLAGATLLRLRLPLPALPEGPYALELSAVAMTPDVQLTSQTQVVVADAKTVQAQPLWVQFGTPRQADDEAGRRAAFAGKPVRRAKPSAKLAAAYRAALATVRSQPVPAVLAAVAELEGGALTAGTAAEWERLVASETQVAEELAKVRPASALALAYLHGELEREYGRRRAYLLGTHARRMTEELALLYADRGGKGARPVASDVLAVLGGAMQQPGTVGTGERLFNRALTVDPANAASLMGLGASLERVGQYRLAAGFLSRVAAVEPDNAEARLRLAVNLARLGKDEESGERLRACIGEANPRWVRVVAYQEMAGGLIRAGRFAQAHGVLAAAVAALPGEEALEIALAYTLDRLRQPLDARAVVERLRPDAAGAGESPRFQYSQWPTDDLERAARRVAEAGEGALPALREALAEPAGSRGRK